MKYHVIGVLMSLFLCQSLFASSEKLELIQILTGQEANIYASSYPDGALIQGCLAAKMAKSLMSYKDMNVEGIFPVVFQAQRVCEYSNISSKISVPLMYKEKLYKVTCYPGTSAPSLLSCALEETSKKKVIIIE